jgi:hypothetical protein
MKTVIDLVVLGLRVNDQHSRKNEIVNVEAQHVYLPHEPIRVNTLDFDVWRKGAPMVGTPIRVTIEWGDE